MDKEAIARAAYKHNPAMTSDQFRTYPNTWGDAKAYRGVSAECARAVRIAYAIADDILALQSSERGEPAKTLEQIATDMDRAIAGGMAWISDDEEVEFARRIRKVASNLSPAEPSPESREGIIEECAKVAEEYPSLEYADIAVVRGIASAIRALSAPAHD